MKQKLKVKNRYKKLTLDFPFNNTKECWENCIKNCTKVPSVFNSNGFYFDRLNNLTWLEVNGETWLYSDRKWFNYNLEMQEREGYKVLSEDIFSKLDSLIKSGLISYKRDKELYSLWYHELCYRDNKKIYKDYALFSYKLRKEYDRINED